jgi:hypothetical protein
MKRILAAALVVCLSAAAVAAQGADPFLGTWRLNLDKSKFPGPPPALPYILTFSANADGSILGIVYALDEKDTRTAVARITYRYDGREYQDFDVVKNVPATNVLSFTQIDRNTVDVTHKLNQGKLVFMERRTVAADGRTMTFVLNATDLRGQTVSVVQVFDRL